MSLKWNFQRGWGVQANYNLPWEGYGYLVYTIAMVTYNNYIKTNKINDHKPMNGNFFHTT